jgi:PAS domain S-box-containing protein
VKHHQETYNQRFESFLIEIANAAVQAHAEAVTSLIDGWLAKLAALTELDRISLWELSQDGQNVRRHAYTGPGCDPSPNVTPAEQFPWLLEQNRLGRIVMWPRVPDDIPAEAVKEREFSLRIGSKSMLSIPVSTDSVLCVLALTSRRKYRRWSRTEIQRMRLVAAILAGAVVRQRTEASLRATEARNRAVLQALPDLMFVLSPDGIYLDYYSRNVSELLMPPERFLNRGLEEVLPPELASTIRAALPQASHSGAVVAIEYALCIDGEKREFEARMVRREDGAIVCIVRNITERSRAARRLQESEERFRGAFEHSAIGMALVGPDGRWIRTNAANCAILGYSEAELLKMNFQELTHPEDLALNLRDFHRALRGEIDHYELEKRYIHKDGRAIPAFLTVSLVRDEQRQPLYFVSQLQDLTERKKAQIEIERLRSDLAHSGRLALTGQLTASLAHQLLQPIAAAQSNAQACQLLLAAGQFNAAELQQALEDIVSSCTVAADVINNVRGLLRKQPRPRQRVNLNQLVEGVIEVARHGLALRNVRLVTHLGAGLPEIVGNPIELQQVILNLVLNGAEALQESAPKCELVIATTLRGQDIEISVHDSGTGIDAADLTRMFEPFFTTKPDGMGMGLTICSEIVHAHGGTIWAEINSMGGLTVRCVLPVPGQGHEG